MQYKKEKEPKQWMSEKKFKTVGEKFQQLVVKLT